MCEQPSTIAFSSAELAKPLTPRCRPAQRRNLFDPRAQIYITVRASQSKNPSLNSWEALELAGKRRQCAMAPPLRLREHQEARRHSETSSRATELRSRRRELQKDGLELQGTLPPPHVRSDRCRRRRRRGQLGAEDVTAATASRLRLASCLCLQPCSY